MFSMWSYGGHHRLKSPADLRVAAPSKISNLYHGWLHYAPPSPSLAIKAWKRPRRSSQPCVHVQVKCRSLYAKAQGHSSVKSTSRYLLWDCKRCPCLRSPYCVCLLLFDSSLNAVQVKRELVWIVVLFPFKKVKQIKRWVSARLQINHKNGVSEYFLLSLKDLSWTACLIFCAHDSEAFNFAASFQVKLFIFSSSGWQIVMWGAFCSLF